MIQHDPPHVFRCFSQDSNPEKSTATSGRLIGGASRPPSSQVNRGMINEIAVGFLHHHVETMGDMESQSEEMASGQHLHSIVKITAKWTWVTWILPTSSFMCRFSKIHNVTYASCSKYSPILAKVTCCRSFKSKILENHYFIMCCFLEIVHQHIYIYIYHHTSS